MDATPEPVAAAVAVPANDTVDSSAAAVVVAFVADPDVPAAEVELAVLATEVVFDAVAVTVEAAAEAVVVVFTAEAPVLSVELAAAAVEFAAEPAAAAALAFFFFSAAAFFAAAFFASPLAAFAFAFLAAAAPVALLDPEEGRAVVPAAPTTVVFDVDDELEATPGAVVFALVVEFAESVEFERINARARAACKGAGALSTTPTSDATTGSKMIWKRMVF